MSWSKEKSEYLLGKHREWYAKNRDKQNVWLKKRRDSDAEKKHLRLAREYHHKNRDRINAKRRAHRKENPSHYTKLRHMRIYGIPPEQFRLMYDAQGGCCLICKLPGKLVVDHDHENGEVRGLLCNPCNTALGLLKEDTARMLAMRDYIIQRSDAAMLKAGAARAKAGLPEGVA
jgi:hypothetical protein